MHDISEENNNLATSRTVQFIPLCIQKAKLFVFVIKFSTGSKKFRPNKF